MAEDQIFRYVASKTGAQFHRSQAFFRGLMGPIGSGKSVTCVEELKYNALSVQEPDKNGVRRSRWACVRNTYPELKATTVQTFLQWWAPEHVSIRWDAPITATVDIWLPDGTRVLAEFLFLALDKPKDVKKLLSLELTGIWFNEAREIPKAVIDAGLGRIGRYPALKDGGPTRAFAIADTNPPDDDHWWYRHFEEDCPHNWALFKQPPALLEVSGEYIPNPEAENIKHLPGGYAYYLNQVGGKTKEWIKVYILGKYGTVEDGKPVYPQYRDDLHCAKKQVPPHSTSGLILGWDFGLTPACIICQVTPRGQFRVLSELVAENMGITAFAREVVKPFLATRYPDHKVVGSYADPAGTGRAQTDERTCIDILNATDEKTGAVIMGFITQSAPSNNPIERIEAVNRFLTKLIDGDPAFVLSPDCKILRKGFNGGYKYERVQVAGDERYKEQPAKNRFSHPHDALQYAALGATQSYTQAKARASWETSSDYKRPVYNV